MRMIKYFHIIAFLLIAMAPTVMASTGDRLPEFQDCVIQCIQKSCPRSLGLLRLLAWDCPADCDYVCQQGLTSYHEKMHWTIHQFHGKWPFVRVFGIQELFSVIFSLLNMLMHIIGFRSMRKLRNTSQFHMRNYYVAFGIVGINTWIWSSVFHMRDLPVTEKLDYFSAIGQILFGLFVAVVRIFRLDLLENKRKRNLLAISLSTFYAGHIYYLSCIRFNYAYNMMAGVIVGLSQTILWVFLGFRLYVRGNNRMDLLPVLIVLSVLMGMTFELNDFSPYWRLLDAHAMWHASTVIPTYLWYKWMKHDMLRGGIESSKRH